MIMRQRNLQQSIPSFCRLDLHFFLSFPCKDEFGQLLHNFSIPKFVDVDLAEVLAVLTAINTNPLDVSVEFIKLVLWCELRFLLSDT